MADVKPPVLLVDFENIQDLDHLKRLRNTDYEIRVFLGPQQAKLPTALVRHAQPFGSRLQWIQMEGNGKNALDFHIAYTIGIVVAEDRKRRIFVLSKDTGFDPLITYLAKRSISCERIEELGKFLTAKDANPSPIKPAPTASQASVENLAQTTAPPLAPGKSSGKAPTLTEVILHLNAIPPRTRPKKPKTLAAHLASHFKKQSPGNDFSLIVKELANLGKISITGDKLSYRNK
ncbi:MAG: PIN domain-containing protein [Rhodocyclaceae bacterium]|nr:PIN domain-containing protein [Rhodocyclaceae bacterium]